MKPVVKIERGQGGRGGPLIVSETETQQVVASITGGGIHPLAQRTADLLGVKAVDGRKYSSVGFCGSSFTFSASRW
ncbi:MAG: hypothetical protein HFH10_11995 [Dorea sp.]|nr:hypothetical protein [Dorea sp.]